MPHLLVFIESIFTYNEIGLRRNPLGSIEVREYSRFLCLKKSPKHAKIRVYADELGDAGPYSKHSPIYSLSLLFLDEKTMQKW